MVKKWAKICLKILEIDFKNNSQNWPTPGQIISKCGPKLDKIELQTKI